VTTRLREWRIANDLTMPEVGGLTGVSVAMLSRLERGQRQGSRKLKVRWPADSASRFRTCSKSSL
jgi:transcriptional regulator with XRE-family HTH domain